MFRSMSTIVTIAALASLTPVVHAQTVPSNRETLSVDAEEFQGLEARTHSFDDSPAPVRTTPYGRFTNEPLGRSATLLPLGEQTDLILRVQRNPVELGVFPTNGLRSDDQLQLLFQVQ